MFIEPVENNPFCLFGWKSPKPCNYTGGCFCDKLFGHSGKCKHDFCGAKKQRPEDWDDKQRKECNS